MRIFISVLWVMYLLISCPMPDKISDSAYNGIGGLEATKGVFKRDGDVYVHYYVPFGDSLIWTSKTVSIDPTLFDDISDDSARAAETAKIVFDQLFSDEEIGFEPEGVYVQDAIVINGGLLLSVSGNIKNYGGSYFEIAMRNQIIKNALSIPGVTNVSLYIDRKLQYLTEGSIIEEEVDWQELTDGLTMKLEE